MMGMDEVTGKLISGEAWLKQAIRRAVRTPKSSRIMTRWYGTNHLKHIAREITNASLLELTSDLSESIERTIPGSKLDTVMDPKNGTEILISLSIGSQNKNIGV
ncbi:MAG: hypothetical protein M3Q07_20695 [Pseudobdellovibrionaceae bacterium]|nr:hypothetical protein [Pseudobdellovibrionaceae bacterium]